MMSDSQRSMLKTQGTLVARILIGGLFLMAGINKFMGGIEGPTGMIEGAGLPIPMVLAWLVVLIEVVGGAMVILGYRIGLAAGVLALFTLGTILFFHLDLEDANLTKNLAIIGGLLYIMAYGPGDGWSLGKGAPQQKSPEPGGMPGGGGPAGV